VIIISRDMGKHLFNWGSLFIAAGMMLLSVGGCQKEDYPTGSVKDADRNRYQTVTIGTQEWMAENLRTSKYNDGSPIPKIIANSEWSAALTGAYCIYGNAEIIAETHGLLYNWFTVYTGKLCPDGWHVPDENEWETLLEYVGGNQFAAAKLKEAGATNWIMTKAETTNETRFTARPGGGRLPEGTYWDLGTLGYWWSSSAASNQQVFVYSMEGSDNSVSKGTSAKKSGLSVRCIRDAE
jgi:uncharacterized protein (TIGR02145 family)